jgi:hypothetical protein
MTWTEFFQPKNPDWWIAVAGGALGSFAALTAIWGLP